jgi:hypothetical protein
MLFSLSFERSRGSNCLLFIYLHSGRCYQRLEGVENRRDSRVLTLPKLADWTVKGQLNGNFRILFQSIHLTIIIVLYSKWNRCPLEDTNKSAEDSV